MYGDNSTPVFPKDDALTMIRLALAEDVRTGDVTSEWTIPADKKQHARLIAKEDGVLAGLPVIELVFQELKANVKVTLHKQDGDVVKKGDLIVEVDLEGVKNAGFDTVTPVIISNSGKFSKIEKKSGAVSAGDTVILLTQ
jgi:nicotinate-nucleotide pyrophosphorylase (carboxylating)